MTVLNSVITDIFDAKRYYGRISALESAGEGIRILSQANLLRSRTAARPTINEGLPGMNLANDPSARMAEEVAAEREGGKGKKRGNKKGSGKGNQSEPFAKRRLHAERLARLEAGEWATLLNGYLGETDKVRGIACSMTEESVEAAAAELYERVDSLMETNEGITRATKALMSKGIAPDDANTWQVIMDQDVQTPPEGEAEALQEEVRSARRWRSWWARPPSG